MVAKYEDEVVKDVDFVAKYGDEVALYGELQ